MISLDALWSEYLKRNFTPLISSLGELQVQILELLARSLLRINIVFVHAAAGGVRAEYMRSEFPTKTFPNHFSIVTVSM